MDNDTIRSLIAEDMAAVDRLIHTRLASDVPLIRQLSHYVIQSGGKRLRPVLALLSAKAHGYTGDKHVDCAAIVELIHTATLLHDDVVDDSKLRRGRETANEVWSNAASVLVGDFIYSRSFQMMVGVGRMRVMEILADTTNTIAEGEVMQLVNCHDPDISEARYLDTIRHKTAKLFEAASRLGAVLTERDAAVEETMAAFGRHLGTAFQLVDDALDYSASALEMGKNLGDDLAEGKPTLPLLYAMWNGDAARAALVREAIQVGGRDRIDQILEAIESTGAIAYTFGLARAEAERAKQALAGVPASVHREALLSLTDLAIIRRS
jgi:octaprenyl-diphosphate synthase